MSKSNSFWQSNKHAIWKSIWWMWNDKVHVPSTLLLNGIHLRLVFWEKPMSSQRDQQHIKVHCSTYAFVCVWATRAQVGMNRIFLQHDIILRKLFNYKTSRILCWHATYSIKKGKHTYTHTRTHIMSSGQRPILHLWSNWNLCMWCP